MKKFMPLLAAVLAIALLAGCAGQKNELPVESEGDSPPDLTVWVDSYIKNLGEDAPALEAPGKDIIEAFYPGLAELNLVQCEIRMAAISAVAFEIAAIEAETPEDAKSVELILQERIDTQVASGAFYPLTVEAWQKASIIKDGNIIVMICAGDYQSDAEASLKYYIDPTA